MQNEQVLFDSLDAADFVSLFGSVYEHSPWVAEQVWRQKAEHPKDYFDDIEKVQVAMKEVVDQSTDEQKLMLLRAHPDLAGKAALAGTMTNESKSEQAGAGLDQCSDEELARFLQLNDEYRSKFGFPFIMAVKGATKDQILDGFEKRTPNDWQTEFDRALNEVHKIASFRLADF
ncbi:2-oxo-4-hydroxy-4-carboxy-5-ureidoimidazoline decarboxylase [Marinomonas sp. GJ51-6]|uniref:2-oxo-4-hydroxy-4-carboxy-5-ureidoimidazoline decarboxylase n=1 Tax=Marinomonas sp. GJ51-6 TaxID=2992802 RepID=UPI0029346B9E|nr:2-oxo-4-hydroxy-4-carboxy-5-ureidoimidazoline decarboxylase [Marinomonas sp. GJ51-6]WOD07698.1 2-oxo-4-hydroxy-4-carboxy-5-ureidoimidazoline decarboxylase [Marinomonas sp. GJ51-6]